MTQDTINVNIICECASRIYYNRYIIVKLNSFKALRSMLSLLVFCGNATSQCLQQITIVISNLLK